MAGTPVAQTGTQMLRQIEKRLGWLERRPAAADVIHTASSQAEVDLIVAQWNPTSARPLVIVRTDRQPSELMVTSDGVMWQHTVPDIAPYIVPTLGNSWVQYMGMFHKVSYMKSSVGIVCMTGLMGAGTGAPAFILPVDCRPDHDLIFPVIASNAIGLVRIVASTGGVSFVAGSNSFVSLTGIMFPAAGVADWTPVTTFGAGWASYHTLDSTFGPVAYWTDPLGRVWTDGMPRQIVPSVLAGDSHMFTIPGVGKNLQSHYPAAGGGGFGSVHVVEASGDTRFFAKNGTNTTWVAITRTVFPDDNIRSDWTENSQYFNSNAKYPDAQFPQRRWIVFEDGIVMQDGLTANGVIGSGNTSISQIIPTGTLPDIDPAKGNNRTGLDIWCIDANHAIARTGAVGTGMNQGFPPFAWEESTGSNAFRSYGGINYVLGG